MNIPNLLTCFRIILIPFFYHFYTTGQYSVSIAVFLIASFTDFLDGRLARKWNQITSFGKLMDPLADKIMVLTALYCLASDGRIPWAILIVILLKEALMVIGSIFLLGKNIVVQANIWGKLATVSFIAAFILVFPWHGVEILYLIGKVLIYISVCLSIWAMIQYAYGIVKKLKETGR